LDFSYNLALQLAPLFSHPPVLPLKSYLEEKFHEHIRRCHPPITLPERKGLPGIIILPVCPFPPPIGKALFGKSSSADHRRNDGDPPFRCLFNGLLIMSPFPILENGPPGRRIPPRESLPVHTTNEIFLPLRGFPIRHPSGCASTLFF